MLYQIRFQSHAGSIEPARTRSERAKRARFQSHAGSIEPRLGLAGVRRMGQGFNPTLVRLSHPNSLIICSASSSFNPTLVRLSQNFVV